MSYFYFNLTTTIILKHSILHDNTRFYKYRHNCLRFIFIIQLQFSIKEFCVRAFSSIYHLCHMFWTFLIPYTLLLSFFDHFMGNFLLIKIIIFSHVSTSIIFLKNTLLISKTTLESISSKMHFQNYLNSFLESYNISIINDYYCSDIHDILNNCIKIL